MRGRRRPCNQPTVRKACREAVRQYVAEELGGLENKTARFQYLFRRLVRAVEQILDNVIEELRVSDFAPIDYELDFSRSGDLPPPCSVRTAMCRFHSPAKVDRVDGYIKNGRLYLRVMDYKSGKKVIFAVRHLVWTQHAAYHLSVRAAAGGS